VVTNNQFHAVLTQKNSLVQSNAKKCSHVDTTVRKHAGIYVHNDVKLIVRKLSRVDMRKVCHVSKILCFTNGVTASASKFSSVAIRVPEHANNAVNATPKLKLNYRVVIEKTFYVQRKTGHHSAPKDAGEH